MTIKAQILGLDHVQLAMPKGGEVDARRFYTGVLGIPEKPKPANLAARGGCWFESDAIRIHLGVDANFRPAQKAHPAIRVQGIDYYRTRLQQAGYRPRNEEELEGYDRFYVDDPFGNRLEFLEPSLG